MGVAIADGTRTMRLRAALLALALCAASAGCAWAERLTLDPLVDVAWLRARLNRPDLVVLDIRTSDEGGGAAGFAQGHVPGALFSDYAKAGWRTEVDGIPAMLPPRLQIEALIGGLGIADDMHVVIVPAGRNAGDVASAARVYWTFKVLGHDAVSVLDGGHRAWTADAANPLAIGPARSVSPVRFTARMRHDLLATAADVEAARAQAVPLIDARTYDQFSGKSKSPVVKRFGTIPEAVNIENGAFYDEKAGRFVGKGEIARLLEAAGVRRDGDIVAFCNTGHLASVAWFGISEVLGAGRTSLYDGSMAEWAADAARPVLRRAQ